MKTRIDNRAKDNAQAALMDIEEMMTNLRNAQEHANLTGNTDNLNSIRQEIDEYALSATVIRQYEILLSTGGPATRLIGDLDEYNEPESVSLQYQDWGTPWTDYPLTSAQEEALLDYARTHYFEG